MPAPAPIAQVLRGRPGPGLGPALLALLLGLAGVLGAWPAAPAHAQDGLFIVRGIEVDVTADSGVAARGKAIDEAQRLGLRKLLERLAPDRAEAVDKAISDEALVGLIEGVDIDSERALADRYIGSFSIAFRPDATRAALERAGVAAEDVRPTVLAVLPVLAGSPPMLWEDPNPWRDAWQNADLPQEKLTLVVPLGDLEDVTTISGEQAVAGEAGPMRALGRRIRAVGTITALLQRPDTPAGEHRVTLQRYSGGGLERTQVLALAPAEGEAEAAFLGRLVAAAIEALRSGTGTTETTPVDGTGTPSTGSLKVAFPFETLGEMSQTERRLRGLPEVTGVDRRALRRRVVTLEIGYGSGRPALDAALAALGLRLVPIDPLRADDPELDGIEAELVLVPDTAPAAAPAAGTDPAPTAPSPDAGSTPTAPAAGGGSTPTAPAAGGLPLVPAPPANGQAQPAASPPRALPVVPAPPEPAPTRPAPAGQGQSGLGPVQQR